MRKTIGLQLRNEREAQTITIEQAASTTHIRANYLRAIESGEFEVLPSTVHVRGFLRAYAEFLGLDSGPVLAELNGVAELSEASPSPSPIPDPEQPGDQNTRLDASAIFAEVGKQLEQQRVLLGLTLEDVERHTHLRQHYLRALEAGDLEGLPSPVQGRGMLNNYAGFLGLNPEPVLLRFADGLQARLEAHRAAQPKPKPTRVRERAWPPSLLRRLFSADILIGGSLVIFLLSFVLWGIIRIFAMTTNSNPTVTAPSIAEVLLATPTLTETFTPLPPSPTNLPQALLFPTLPIITGTPGEEESSPPESSVAVQVYLTIHQRAWMRVTVDGNVEFEGRVIPGSAYPFIGDSQVEVLTGNGAALQVFYNGSDLGLLGEPSEIIDLIYTSQGVFAPTPTVTLTPSATTPTTATPTGAVIPTLETPTLPPLP